MSTDLRSVLHSQDHQYPLGRLADAKQGNTSDPGYPQPRAAEALLAAGLSDEVIDRLADDFIAEDRGQATERFIHWAIRVRHTAARRAAGADAR